MDSPNSKQPKMPSLHLKTHHTTPKSPSKQTKTTQIEIIDLSNLTNSEQTRSRSDRSIINPPKGKKARFHSPVRFSDHEEIRAWAGGGDFGLRGREGEGGGDGNGDGYGGRVKDGGDEGEGNGERVWEKGSERMALTEENLTKFRVGNPYLFGEMVFSEGEVGVVRTVVWVEEMRNVVFDS